MTTEPYLSASALAIALGVSRSTLYKAINSGDIVGYRLHGTSQRRYLLSEAREAFRPVADLDAEMRRACERAAKRAVQSA